MKPVEVSINNNEAKRVNGPHRQTPYVPYHALSGVTKPKTWSIDFLILA